MTRIEQFLEKMTQLRLDGFLVTSRADVRWLCNFSGSAGILWVSPQKCLFLTDFRYQTQAEKQIGGLCEIHITSPGRGTLAILAELEVAKGKSFIGFDSTDVNYSLYKQLMVRFPDANLIPVPSPLDSLRAVKESEEVEKIRQAAKISAEALIEVLPLLRPGITELEFAAELQYRLLRKGTPKVAFDPIVVSGKRAALPHGMPTDKVIEKGDMVTVDFGATHDGYVADITRTFVLGTPDEKFRQIYQIVLDAHIRAVEFARAGVSGKDVDAVARNFITTAGFGEYFGHGLGHGIGLVVHDTPGVNSSNENPLPIGAVVTIEPGIYIPEWGGVRIEDDYLVGENGLECLSCELPKKLADMIVPVA